MINRRCGIGIAAEIELLRTGLRVRFVLPPDVIACQKRRRTLCHLHLYPLAGRVVGKRCGNASSGGFVERGAPCGGDAGNLVPLHLHIPGMGASGKVRIAAFEIFSFAVD